VPTVTNLPRNIEELLRRKGSYSMTPEQRKELGFRVLHELAGSFKGDSQAMIDALDPSRDRG